MRENQLLEMPLGFGIPMTLLINNNVMAIFLSHDEIISFIIMIHQNMSSIKIDQITNYI